MDLHAASVAFEAYAGTGHVAGEIPYTLAHDMFCAQRETTEFALVLFVPPETAGGELLVGCIVPLQAAHFGRLLDGHVLVELFWGLCHVLSPVVCMCANEIEWLAV